MMPITPSSYQDFLGSKRHSIGDHGFHANWIPDCAFDFQRHIIAKAITRFRSNTRKG